MTITFGSVCSGIEAASVAWNPLGWRASWLAEIEPFPCAVLAHHYPDVPNLGNMLAIPAMLRNGDIPPPDVFTGGTPCQAFSVAGLRNSLDDARGNLSLTFCEIANEIDIQRAANGLLPATVLWENVPGVLSTQDNAFGCFLAGLAGEDDPLVPPGGGKWSNAGCVFGPQRVVAWRTLDAQFFGLAQRRRRVFVVASARKGFDPCAILFEPESLHRNSAPSRQAGQDVTGTISARTTGGGGLGTDFELGGGLQPVGGVKWPAEITPTLNAAFGSKLGLENQHIRGGQDYSSLELARCLTTKTRIDAETETLIPTIGGHFISDVQSAAPVAHAFDARQSDVIQYGDFTGPLDTCGFTIGVLTDAPTSYAIQAGALRENPNSGPDGVGVQEHIAYTLEARSEVQAVAFSCKDYGGDATTELAPTMRAMNHAGSHANAGGQLAVCVGEPIPIDMRQASRGATMTNNRAEGSTGGAPGTGIGKSGDPCPTISTSHVPAVCVTGDITHTLKAEGFDASEDGTGRGQPIVASMAFAQNTRDEVRILGGDGEIVGALAAQPGMKQTTYVAPGGMAVRRLTPRECERLQGFSDDYTLIPGKRKNIRPLKLDRDYIKYLMRGGVRTFDECMNVAADGPRYKALGNSWAIPNVRWIGRRIDAALRALESR